MDWQRYGQKRNSQVKRWFARVVIRLDLQRKRIAENCGGNEPPGGEMEMNLYAAPSAETEQFRIGKRVDKICCAGELQQSELLWNGDAERGNSQAVNRAAMAKQGFVTEKK